METIVYVIFAVVVLALLAVIVVLALRPRRIEVPDIESMEQKLLFALASQTSVREIQEILKDLPRDVMQSITGSLSKRTGKLNELLATLEMTKYDRLFYLESPIDFVGIKYDEGVDFIERVYYVPLKVERIKIPDEIDTEEMDTGE
jgi:hypothetical protein